MNKTVLVFLGFWLIIFLSLTVNSYLQSNLLYKNCQENGTITLNNKVVKCEVVKK